MLRFVTIAISCCLAISVSDSPCNSQESNSEGDYSSASNIQAITRSVIETVLEKHIQPPARQQMVLEVIREIASEFGKPASPELSLANATSAAGVPVFCTQQSLNPAIQFQMASVQPIRESIPVRGTDYFVQICTTRLLDMSGATISGGGNRNAMDDLSTGGHPGKLISISSKESELSLILKGLK